MNGPKIAAIVAAIVGIMCIVFAVGRLPATLDVHPLAPQVSDTSGKAKTSKVLQGIERGK